MKYIIDCLYLLAVIIIAPKVLYRIIRHGRYRSGWAQRLGHISRREPHKKCIWIHAVSVGEVNATRTLVDKLSETLPDYEIVLSSTTDTGYERAMAIYSEDYQVFYFPFDLSIIIRRAFRNINPSICLLMELEVWPNFASIADKTSIPVVVVNGRLSDKSFPRYKMIRPAAKWMFSKVSLVLAQTEEYAQRFRELGCPPDKVLVTSSLKYDTAQITDKVDGSDILAERLNIENDKLWVAGGTGPGEEKIILDVFEKLKIDRENSNLRLAIIPRKPERFDEVAQLIEQTGRTFVCYSELKENDSKVDSKPEIILGDTMGDLKKFYSLATVPVFVGRSLVPMGGSDMMESAALGKCTVFGPHTFNFKHTVEVLLAGEGAIAVAGGRELHETMQKCLVKPDYVQKIADNGREVIRQNQGATQRTVDAIVSLL